jgi:signal transduction histidine kinase
MRTAISKNASTWDAPTERRFLAEYRDAGLNATAYACIAGAAMYAAFLVIALLSEVYSVGAVGLRAFLIAMLSGAAWVFLRCREFSRHHYVAIAGLTCVITLGATVVMPHLPSKGSPPVPMLASPAIVFGLFMLYAFLRLPLVVASLIGWVIGLFAAILVPAVAGGNEPVRGVVYLLFANLAGMRLCRTAESRERVLFQQRMELEVARLDARERAAIAEEANRDKARLIAAISHDLRQPMTAAAAYLSLTCTRLAGEEPVRALESTNMARAAVSALGDTLDNLLTAARYDGQHGPLLFDVSDANALAQGARDSFALTVAGGELEIRIRLSRRPVFVVTDKGSIARVLSNVIGNAVKFTPAGGKVLIAVRRSRSRVWIEVFDTGVGIAPSQLGEIWRPFVQLGNPERNREHGLGLGLFLVRRIVDQLPDHSIKVYSKVGRGSHFRIALPAAMCENPVEVAIAPDIELPSADDLDVLAGAYVMLVEDDIQVRLSLEELMSEWQVLVVGGATVERVLLEDAGSDRLVDAIVCDFRLPCSENGLNAVDRVRQQLGYAPSAIVITGESDIEVIRAAAADRIVVLQKPFSTAALAAHLADATRRSRQAELL